MITADGVAIGSISELFISADWRVESICIELRKDIADLIGASRSLFHQGTIEVPVSVIQSVGDAVVLTVEVDKLREARPEPTSDAATRPSP